MGKVIGHLVRYLKQSDFALMLATLAAALFGFVMVYSAINVDSGGIGKTVLTQAIAIILGTAAMIVIARTDYHTIAAAWKILAVIGAGLLLLTIVWGKGRTGSNDKSWLTIPLIKYSLQPSEIVKVMFVVTFSKHYDLVKDTIHSPKTVLLLSLHGLIAIGLILLQQDMGMCLVFTFIFVSMMFAANVKLRYFLAAGLAVVVTIPLVWHNKIFYTQTHRITALFSPQSSANKDELMQQTIGKTFIGSGEIWGYGLFKGPHKSILPERKNDMIFAIIGQELGFIGCLAVILLLTFILVRVLINSRTAKDDMGSMMCIGIFAMFAVQIIVNIGMCLMLFPVVGLTLPFFSSGGTSVLSCFMAVGLVLSVHYHRKNLMFAGQDV